MIVSSKSVSLFSYYHVILNTSSMSIFGGVLSKTIAVERNSLQISQIKITSSDVFTSFYLFQQPN